MDKKVINKEQFKKLVIEEAKKFFPKEDLSVSEKESNRKITFNKVESLINEMKNVKKSISSLIENEVSDNLNEGIKSLEEEGSWSPKRERDLDVNIHNKKKNIIHVNENEKDKWNRMLKYNIPSDNDR
jgi:hypothetical protein